MESLALAAAGIVLLLISLSVGSVCLSLAGRRVAGASVGVVSLASLAWFATVAPQVWAFWLPLALASAWAIKRGYA